MASGSMFSLAGRVALVTGGSSGLGRHFAKTLAKAGAKVAVGARRRAKLDELVLELQGQGYPDVFAVSMDVSSEKSIHEGVAEIEDRLGPINILVNNAGIAVDKPALRQTAEDFTSVVAVNLTGPWLVAQAVARRMVRDKRGGSIINIASVAGLAPSAYMPGYCASKAGLVHLTRALALEWARHGIRVNAIAPGYILTEINSQFFADPKMREAVERKTPQRRIGQPSDLDGMLLLMASEEASGFMTGSIVNVDGGMLVSNL